RNLVRIMRSTSRVEPSVYTRCYCPGCQVAQYGHSAFTKDVFADALSGALRTPSQAAARFAESTALFHRAGRARPRAAVVASRLPGAAHCRAPASARPAPVACRATAAGRALASAAG